MRRQLAAVKEKETPSDAPNGEKTSETDEEAPVTRDVDAATAPSMDLTAASSPPTFQKTLERQIAKLKEKEDALNGELTRVRWQFDCFMIHDSWFMIHES